MILDLHQLWGYLLHQVDQLGVWQTAYNRNRTWVLEIDSGVVS
jgi:hypothetical protein